MHAGILVARDDVTERGRPAHQFGNAGRVRLGRDHREIRRAESEIDQNHIGFMRQRPRQRDCRISCADVTHSSDHGDARRRRPPVASSRANCSTVLATNGGMPIRPEACRSIAATMAATTASVAVMALAGAARHHRRRHDMAANRRRPAGAASSAPVTVKPADSAKAAKAAISTIGSFFG